MRRALGTAALLPLLLGVLTACDEDGSGTPEPATASIEESWSQLFHDLNVDLQADPDLMQVGEEKCLDGDHGARLTVARAKRAYTYGFGEECGIDRADAVLQWPETGPQRIERGEKVLRTIAAAYAPILEARRVAADTTFVAEAVEEYRRSNGSYPPSLDRSHLPDLYLDARINDYEVTGSGFRLCSQSVADGPWEAYDSTVAGGLVAVGDDGRCSFEPPPADSERSIRRDLEVLAHTGTFGCGRRPSDRALRDRGVLGKGHRVAGCDKVEWQEGEVITHAICLQHGKDGAWGVYDEVNFAVTAPKGECDLTIEEVVHGPYGW